MVRTLSLLLLFFGLKSLSQAGAPVSFRAEIAGLLQRRCAACHSEESAKGGYRLDKVGQLLKSGESDLPPLVAGKPEESELYRLLVEPDAHDRMPQKAPALPNGEIALIERWIREGGKVDGALPEQPLVELARESFLRAAPERYSHAPAIGALAFSPDGKQLATSGYYEVLIWNLADGSLAQRVGGLPERITSLAWSSATQMLAVAGGSPGQWGGVALVDPRAGFQVRYLCDLPDTALSVAFSPDGATLASGAADRTVRFFETASGKPIRVSRQHADWVQSVSFSSDGKRLVSASRDRTARVFNVQTGEMDTTYNEHGAPLLAATFYYDNVLSLARGGMVHAWNAASGGRWGEFPVQRRDAQQLAWIGESVLTAGTDGRVHVEQVNDRRELFALAGHGDVVQSVAVAPDGGTFASGAANGTVCVWDLACGTWVRRFVAVPLR